MELSLARHVLLRTNMTWWGLSFFFVTKDSPCLKSWVETQNIMMYQRLEQILGGKRKSVCIRIFFYIFRIICSCPVTGFLFLGGVKCRPQETFLSQCHVGLGKVKSTDTQHHSLFFLEIVIRPTNKMWVIWTPSCW